MTESTQTPSDIAAAEAAAIDGIEGVEVSISDHVATVVMAKPPHNFLSFEQIGNLATVFERLEKNMDVRAGVLAADGRSFCAGANFSAEGGAVGGDDPDEVVGGSATLRLYQEAARFFRVNLPIVGAVQGPAVGGGLGLAMVPDIRVAAPEARFCANFATLGIHQGFGLTITLPKVVGETNAARMLFTGKRYNGEEAVEIGLADECVPADQLRARAQEIAGDIARNAPLALRSIKSSLRLGLADEIMAITDREAAEQAQLSATNDAAEGIASVGERRPGNFTGS